MHPGRGDRRRDSHAEQDSARDLAERHAERAIDHLRHEPDQDEGQEGGRVSQDFGENFARSTLFSRA